MFEEIGKFIDHLPTAVVKFTDAVAKGLEKNMSLWLLIIFNAYLLGGITWTIVTSVAVGWWLLLAILPILLAIPYAIALIRKIRSHHEKTV